MAISFTPGQVISWEDLNAMLAQHGSPQGAKSIVTLPPRTLSEAERQQLLAQNIDPDDPSSQPTVVRYWMEDGSHFDAVLDQPGERDAENRGGQGSTFRIVDYKPSTTYEAAQRRQEAAKPSEEEGTTRGPQTGPTREVKRGGQWVVEPNPIYQAPGAEAASPTQQHEAILNQQRQRNAALPQGQDPRYETDQERATRAAQTIKEQGIAAQQAEDRRAREAKELQAAKEKADKENQPQITIKEVKQPDGSTKNVQVRIYPGGREEVLPSAVPGQPAPVKPEQDKYSTVRTDPDTGESMGLTRGANPHWEVIPVQGQAATRSGGNVTWPTIAVGMSQDALRTAYDAIQAAVDNPDPTKRQTPAWGENRRKEVMEAARLTVQEAQLHENSRQFNQSQAESLATTKLNYGQGALKFALQSALSINGKLKPGSSAGANMFRDLFLFQMQMARDSGIYGITPGGGQSSVGQGMPGAPTRAGNPQTRPPITPGDKEAHAVSADERAANLAAGLEGSGAPREYTPVGSPGAAVPPPTTGAPPPPAALPTTAGAPVPAPSPVSSAPPPPLTNPAQAPGSGPTIKVADPWGNEFDMTQQQIDNRPANSPPLTRVGAPQAMTPPSDTFPALEAFRMPLTPRPQIDPLAASNPGDPMVSPAIQAARIAAIPPWLLPPDQLESLVRQHGEDVVFKYPGMPLEGAA